MVRRSVPNHQGRNTYDEQTGEVKKMNKKILIGCILVACIMMVLPSTTVAESNSAEDRIKLKEVVQEQIEETLNVRDGPHEPTLILRLLLVMRNLLLLGIVGIIGIIFTIINLINNNSSA
jgi:hypothetical protein